MSTKATEPAAQAPAVAAVFTPCPHTGAVAERIASDASALVELLSDVIGQGAEAASELAGACLMAARIGMLADALQGVHAPGPPVRGEPMEWLFAGDRGALEAWAALRSQGAHK